MKFNELINTLTDDNELDNATLRLLSMVFLLLSGIMSFFKYTHIGWLWDTSVTFKPGLISSIIAIVLIAPLYVRGLLKWNKSIYSIVSFVLILLVFASFVELAMGGNDKKGIITAMLAISVVLSWLGIKQVAGIGWMLTLAAAIYAAILNDMAMGFYGFVYIGSGFIGLVLHSGLNPGELYQGIKNEYSSSTQSMFDHAKDDISKIN